MKPLKYFIFLIPLLIAFGCRKKEYPKSYEEPGALFSASFTVDNTPVSITAGKDGYYLFSSNEQNANNVYSFISNLKKVGCDNCANSLEIRINDATVTPQGAGVKINQAIKPQTYTYLSDTTYLVQFQSSFNKTATSTQWNFGDGGTSSSANPSHLYTQKGKYTVNYTAISSGGCVSNISYPQNIGVKNNHSSSLNVFPGVPNTFSFSVNTSTPALQYLWNFGDGTAYTTNSSVTLHSYNIAGSYPVSVSVWHGANDSSHVKYNLVTQTDNSSCAANYSVSSVTEILNSLKLGQVTVNWTDDSGIKYTSDYDLQPLNSFFEVLEVSDAEDNEKGEKTKKVRVRFKCMVYNGAQSKLINNAQATICISYK